ncbi:MAG: hypothetical protein VX906_05055 [Candidatus Thermoplasmatota archaeon]|nr:hypothetical protein [Candidatus Thermoplasmatota archaeon]
MSNELAIRPTKHALDRFRQRVLPLLPEDTRADFRKYNQMKHLIKRVQLYTEDFFPVNDGLLKANVFVNLDKIPPIPLTFIINPVNNVIVTLYVQSGWDITSNKGEITWRWSA